MTEITWKGDLKALYRTRKALVKNLRFLSEQAAKSGELSISLRNQIDDTKKELRRVEADILELEAAHKAALVESDDLPRPLEPSIFGKEEQSENSIEDSRFDDAPSLVTPYYPKLRLLHAIAIVVVILMVVLASIALLRPLVERQQAVATTGPTSVIVPGEIQIYLGYYHLGDVIMDNFHAPVPQQNPFVGTFEVGLSGEQSQLVLTTSHVDPNYMQAPVDVYINGIHVTDLNHYVSEETLEPVTVQIPLETGLVRVGVNEIKIEVGVTNAEYGKTNMDDFEFWNLKLIVE